MLKHKEKKIAIKEARVDDGICNFVKWLNKFSSVFTLYSCEGNLLEIPGIGKTKEFINCYVLFYCRDKEQLKIIFDCMASYKQSSHCTTSQLAAFSIETSYCKSLNDDIAFDIRFKQKTVPDEIVKYYYDVYKKEILLRLEEIP